MPAARLATAQTVVRVFDLVVILLDRPERLARRARALAGRGSPADAHLPRDRRGHRLPDRTPGDERGTERDHRRHRRRRRRAVPLRRSLDSTLRGPARRDGPDHHRDRDRRDRRVPVGTTAGGSWPRPRTSATRPDALGLPPVPPRPGAPRVSPRRAPDRDDASNRRSARTARSSNGTGSAIVVFILVWLALGLEVALLGAALVVGFELILRAVAGPSGDEATETSFERSSPGSAAPVVAPVAG